MLFCFVDSFALVGGLDDLLWGLDIVDLCDCFNGLWVVGCF